MLSDFLAKFPLKGNKKVRKTVNNHEHWTGKYFKFRGTLTVSQTTNDTYYAYVDKLFETKESFLSFVTDERLWTGMFLLTSLVATAIVDNRQTRRHS